jgi:hypothetical protein
MNNKPFIDTRREVFFGSTIQDSGEVPKPSYLSKDFVCLGSTVQDSGKVSSRKKRATKNEEFNEKVQELEIAASLTLSSSKKYKNIVEGIRKSIDDLRKVMQKFNDLEDQYQV